MTAALLGPLALAARLAVGRGKHLHCGFRNGAVQDGL